jgi:MFS family permease
MLAVKRRVRAGRGTAAAIFSSAQYSAVLFAPLMGWLVHAHGWQSMFYLMGASLEARTCRAQLYFSWAKTGLCNYA